MEEPPESSHADGARSVRSVPSWTCLLVTSPQKDPPPIRSCRLHQQVASSIDLWSTATTVQATRQTVLSRWRGLHGVAALGERERARARALAVRQSKRAFLRNYCSRRNFAFFPWNLAAYYRWLARCAFRSILFSCKGVKGDGSRVQDLHVQGHRGAASGD